MAACVSSLGWLCGFAQEIGDRSLLKQNNKSEQISFIVVGSDVARINFSSMFLKGCSRNDTLRSQVV